MRVTAPEGAATSFGESMVAAKVPVVSLEFNYAINSFFVTTTTANGGTVAQSGSMAALTTSTAANGSALLESKAAVRYLPGTGVFASFTALFTACAASSQQEIGLGDANDGMFIGCQNGTFGTFLRKGSVDAFTALSASSVDKLDGTGPSGLVLVPTNLNLFKVSFGWHGAGPVRWFLFDALHNRWAEFHAITATVTSPRVLNPTLPLHVKVVNSGNATNLTVKTASMGAYREGGPSPAPDAVSSSSGSAGNAKAVTTEANIITLQNMSTVFGGAANKVRVKVTQFCAVDTTGTAAATVRAVLNTTLGGAPSFSAFDASTSVAATDTAGTTLSGGRQVYRQTLTTNAAGNSLQCPDLTSSNIILNPGDTITFSGATAGGAQTIDISVEWVELFAG